MNDSLTNIVRNKNVLFITTKNIDYLRNTQELGILRETAKEVRTIYSKRHNYLLRILEVWWKTIGCKTKEFDVIFAGFSPQLLLPFYWKFKKKVVVIDFFISVYDTLVNDRKNVLKRGIVAWFCHWLDSFTIRRADHIITDTKEHQRYFLSEFGGITEQFETLYLEADQSIYFPRKQEKPSRLKDKYVVLYFGSILPLQGVDVVLKAAEALKDHSSIWIQIIGPVSKEYKKPIQDNIEYVDWLEQKELAEYIANSDLCLAGHFCSTIEKAKRTIPGKAYIYRNMKKPMILGDNLANRELFVENETCMFVKMGDAEVLRDAILEMYQRNT